MKAEFNKMDEKIQTVVLERLDIWIGQYNCLDSGQLVDIVKDLKQSVCDGLPF